MVTTTKQPVASKASLTSSSLSTLASGTYCVSSSYNCATNGPTDLVLEVTAGTTNTPSGNKQLMIFAQASYDGGTVWQSGPTSGTSAASEGSLTFLGYLPIPTTSVNETKGYNVSAAFGFVLPPMLRFVLKNDLGVALTTGTLPTAEVSYTTG